jgi:hypothetical protein
MQVLGSLRGEKRPNMWPFQVSWVCQLGFYRVFKKPLLRDGQVFGQKAILFRGGLFLGQIQRLRRKAKFVAYLVLLDRVPNWTSSILKFKKPLFREGQ